MMALVAPKARRVSRMRRSAPLVCRLTILFLLGGRAHQELEHADLVRVGVLVPHPVEVEPQLPQHGTPFDQVTEIREVLDVVRRAPRMDAEGGQHEGTLLRQREVALVRGGVHGVGQGQDAPALDPRQRFPRLVVVVEMGVGVDQHDGEKGCRPRPPCSRRCCNPLSTHTESRRFASALRATRCSRRLNGTYGRSRASGQYCWPNPRS